MTVKGVDVSAYQSATYDTSGLSFVFVKATEGTGYANPKQAAQAAHARAAECVVGFYHFLHPGNVGDQARYFVAKCASQAGDILACDWEPTTSGLASNADKDAFIKAVKQLRPDHKVILYCDVSRWTRVDTTAYCGDGLWIADPNHPAGSPAVQHPWTFHQYGIRGVDVDVANFPSRAALAAWASGTAQPQEADMQLSDQVTLGTWIPQYWPNDKGVQDRKLPVDVLLGSGYAHARIAHENSAKILAQLGAQQAVIAKLVDSLAAGGGLTAAEIQAAAEAGAKAALDQLGAKLQED